MRTKIVEVLCVCVKPLHCVSFCQHIEFLSTFVENTVVNHRVFARNEDLHQLEGPPAVGGRSGWPQPTQW